MSGFEVAGLILGTFAAAAQALEVYRWLATRAKCFREIRVHHTACDEDIQVELLFYQSYLKQILLLALDIGTVERMLADPSDTGWKDAVVHAQLNEKLGDSHPIYVVSMKKIEQTVTELNKELAWGDFSIQESLKSTGPLSKADQIKFRKYRFRFSNRESVRTSLIAKLKADNGNLKRLVELKDREGRQEQQIMVKTRVTAFESALCCFWVQAEKLFRALASACSCNCEGSHAASLLLQHRTEKKAEFVMLFTTSGAASWGACRTRISEGDMGPSRVSIPGTASADSAPHAPSSPTRLPLRPAVRSGPSGSSRRVRFSGQSSTITLTVPEVATQQDGYQTRITILCKSLEQPSRPCCGFLHLQDEDCRYYVYPLEHHVQATDMGQLVSLEQILNGQVGRMPPERARYALALVLASSFLQLLHSPWLPHSFIKSSIVFQKTFTSSGSLVLNQPHVLRELATMSAALTVSQGCDPSSSKLAVPSNSLKRLGVLLLEVFFAKPLGAPALPDAIPQNMRDEFWLAMQVAAAEKLLPQLEEEAAADYVLAVRWCLGGNMCTAPDKWRQEMLAKVVGPLQSCHDILRGAGVTSS
ncbi:hypothetical protein RB595_000128 [Gaeumannomyces hyphopodioides]